MAEFLSAIVPAVTKALDVAQPHIAAAASGNKTDASSKPSRTVISAGKNYMHGNEQKFASATLVCDIDCKERDDGMIVCPAEAKCSVVTNSF
jgi:hypothetical protein